MIKYYGTTVRHTVVCVQCGRNHNYGGAQLDSQPSVEDVCDILRKTTGENGSYLASSEIHLDPKNLEQGVSSSVPKGDSKGLSEGKGQTFGCS